MKLHKCTSQDSIRLSLTHVCIDADNVVATDAHVIVIIPKRIIFKDQDIPEMFVRGIDWAKIYPRSKHELKYEDGHLVLYKQTKNGYCRRIVPIEVARVKPVLKDVCGFTYPEYRKIIPNEKKTTKVEYIGVKLSLFKMAMDGLGTDRIKITFYNPTSGMLITPLDEELKGCKALVMPTVI